MQATSDKPSRDISSKRATPSLCPTVVARKPSATLSAELGPFSSAGVDQAAEADIVFLATRWQAVPDVLDALPNWNGRILVDTTNAFELIGDTPVPVDLGDRSGSEIVAAHAPGARVVKAFNTLYAAYIEPDPRHEAGGQVVFYAGDDVDTKATMGVILDELGFAPVDIGRLRWGGRLMQVNGCSACTCSKRTDSTGPAETNVKCGPPEVVARVQNQRLATCTPLRNDERKQRSPGRYHSRVRSPMADAHRSG